MKKLKMLLCVVMIFALIPVLPAAGETASQNDEYDSCDQTVVLSYEEALVLALEDMVAINDIEIAIRNLQVHRIWFRDEMRRLESGRGTLQINAMQEMLQDLDFGIQQAQQGQLMLEAMTGMALQEMQDGIAGIAGPDSTPEQVAALQQSLTGLFMSSAPNPGAQVFSMQAQRTELSREINRLRRQESIEETRREITSNVNELDRQTTALEMGREQAELSVETILRSLISAQIELEFGIENFQASTNLLEMNLNRMTVMHQVGMVSTHDLAAMQHNVAQNHSQLESMERTRQTLMHNLNNLLGQPLYQNTIIEFERNLHEPPEDLDEHITNMINETHTVRSLRLELERAIDARWVYTGSRASDHFSVDDRHRAHNPNRRTHDLWDLEQTTEDEEIESLRTRIALQEAVERAETNLNQTIRQMETNIRRAYRDLDALVVQYETVQINHVRALEDLDVVKTNLGLGLVTQFEVEQALLAANVLERTQEEIMYQKWALSFRLENPTLLQ